MSDRHNFQKSWVAGKPKKKPDYDPEVITKELIDAVTCAYEEGLSLNDIIKKLNCGLNPIKVRKLLITANVYKSPVADRVRGLYQKGKSVEEIMIETKLSRASVHSYLPYTKAVYHLDDIPGGDISVGQERQKRYIAVKRLKEAVEDTNSTSLDTEKVLWSAVCAFQGYVFKTAKGLRFTYTVKGGEVFVDRKEKSITRATVDIAFRKAIELGHGVTGPKKLGVFGASYLYPIFVRLGVIQKA